MAQAKTSKLYRTFVRGLMTEASYLTYPEDTSFDELNTVPSRKGNRTRRLGIDYNSSDFTPRPYDVRNSRTEFVWRTVGGNSALNFLVVQNAAEVTFYDRSDDAFESNRKSFSVNLDDYRRPGAESPGVNVCHFASGKGYLFIVNKDTEPLVVTYNMVDDSISVQPIAILARDFEGLPDGLQNDEEPPTLSTEHRYNLQNQGWVPGKTSTSTRT